MFTRRHYEAIAKAFQQVYVEAPDSYKGWGDAGSMYEGIATVQGALSLMFEADNANFDIKRFIEACEPSEQLDRVGLIPHN